MKTTFQKLPLAFILIISFSFHFTNAKSVSIGDVIKPGLTNQTSDSSLVFQLCLDMPELQSFYPKNEDGSYPPVYVMQFPVAFPSDIAVSKFQQNIVFESRGDIYTNKREAFFIVKSFLIEGDSATVVFDYNHHYTSSPAALEVKLTLQKTGTEWAISNTITSQRY